MEFSRRVLNKVNAYARLRPYTFSSLAAGTAMSLGDLISQAIESNSDEGKFQFSLERNVRLSLCGFIYFGPTVRFWYGALDRLVRSRTFFRPLKMLVIDQALFIPCYLVTVLFTTKLARGQSPASIVENFPTDYPNLLFGNWKVWPWVQIVNFTVIPLQFRSIVFTMLLVSRLPMGIRKTSPVLFGNFVAVFWNSYVSRISSNRQKLEGIHENSAELTSSSGIQRKAPPDQNGSKKRDR